MKAQVTTLAAGNAGDIELSEEIFGLDPRPDILHRVVVWQLAKRRDGTHKVKSRSEVKGSTRKIYAQKGTGRARHGARTANVFRGGGVAHGPSPRSHDIKLPKKVRKAGLKHALSAKLRDQRLIVIDEAKLDEAKTKTLKDAVGKHGWTNVLVIDGPELDQNFLSAARNLPNIDVLPTVGANVYDILRRDVLVLTKSAVGELEARLK